MGNKNVMRRLLPIFLFAGTLAAGPKAPLDDVLAEERALEALQHRLLDITGGSPQVTERARRACADHVELRGFGEPTATTGALDRFQALVKQHGLRSLAAKPLARRGANAADVAVDLRGAGAWIRAVVTVTWGQDERIRAVELRRVRVMPAPTKKPFHNVTESMGLSKIDPLALQHPTLGLAAYGAATGDLNNDGRLDLVTTAHDGNTAYIGQADGPFRAIKLPSAPGTAPLLLDFDNDGDQDIFFSRNGKQGLLRNEFVPKGTLTFRDVSEAQGVAVASIGFAAVAGDVNSDGRPDIYVAAYNNYGPVAPESWDNARNGMPNLLFVSQKDGTYLERAKTWRVNDTRWSYAAQFIDIDEDGRLDLYVANDFGAGNALYMRERGHFVDRANEWGIADRGYAMGVSFGDYNNDGAIDLHVTRMSSHAGARILRRLGKTYAHHDRLRWLSAGNGLYERIAMNRFEDVTTDAGPFRAGWAWGGGFWDYDNDGLEDLFTPNGHMSGTTMKDT